MADAVRVGPHDGADEASRANVRTVALKTVLVRQTLEFAAETVPVYKELYARAGVAASNFSTLTDLSRFPRVDRAHLASDIRSFLAPSARPEFVRSTSGTTGKRLVLYGCHAELEAHRALFRAFNDQMVEPTIILRISPPVRRLHSPAITPDSIVNLAVAYIPEQLPGFWLTHTDFVHQLLSEEYVIGEHARQITVLHITPPYLLESLTTNLRAIGIDPHTYEIQTIVLTGGHATQRHKQICSEAWGAQCITTYSCTEILGGCPELAGFPPIYSDTLAIHAEVVDPSTGKHALPGRVGTLVLSSLYPFQQTVPLIRYEPGDWARSVQLANGQSGFQLVGRKEQCLFLSDEVVVGPSTILDVLSSFEQIPQIPGPRFQYTDQSSPGRKCLRVDVESNPVSDRLRRQLEDAIGGALASTIKLDSDTDVIVRVYPKGALARYIRIYPES
jgi:phenylacetate-coenzyme A ligase PaaK-like adenylate-forming protein